MDRNRRDARLEKLEREYDEENINDEKNVGNILSENEKSEYESEDEKEESEDEYEEDRLEMLKIINRRFINYYNINQLHFLHIKYMLMFNMIEK